MNLTVQHVDGMRFRAMTDVRTDVLGATPQSGGGSTVLSAPQLFLAVLGACILEFVANSCRLCGMPVERLSLEVAYEEVQNPRRVGSLEMAIRIEPDLPAEVKRQLLGAARHDTATKTLIRSPEVEICFAEA